MKKILFVVHSFGIGGVETVLTNIANALSTRGYDITICVTSNNLAGAHSLLPEIKLKHRDEPKFRLFKKLPYIRNFYESGMWSRRKSPEKLYRYFVGTKENFDVEIAFFFGRPIKTIYGSPNDSSKKILFVHNDYKFSYGGVFAGFSAKEDALQAYYYFDKVVCVSESVKESFIEIIGRKNNVIVIYNLNDDVMIKELADKCCNFKREKFTFITASRLEKEKGIDRVLLSVKKLNSKGYDFDVVILGDGSKKLELEEYAVKNNLNNVKFLGGVKNPYSYIKMSDILICASEVEPYGMVVSEAYLLNKPVICTDSGGPTEITDNGKYGILVENSADGIYSAMEKVLTDKSFYNHFIQLAKERRPFFESEHILRQIESMLFE